jgi:hypothetical protein
MKRILEHLATSKYADGRNLVVPMWAKLPRRSARDELASSHPSLPNKLTRH